MRGSNLKYFLVGAFVVAGGLSVLAAVNLTPFQPGTPIKASEVNQNFSVLKSAVDSLEADGSVTRQRLKTKNEPGPGQVLSYDGEELAWRSVAGVTGVINSVTAGTGLTGGGVSGDVTLGIADKGIANAQLADGSVNGPKLASGAVTGPKIALPLSLEATSGITLSSKNLLGTAALFEGSTVVNGVLSATQMSVVNELKFDPRTRQMINLFGTPYGIGVQAATQYLRSDKNFAWYVGGSHNDGELNPGGGTALMSLTKDPATGSGLLGVQRANISHVVIGDIVGTKNNNKTLEVDGIIRVKHGTTSTGVPLALTTTGIVVAGGFDQISDRNAKENFAPVNPQEALQKLLRIPVQSWNYKNVPDHVRHVGPMAQDFHAAFGLNGSDDKHISVVDAQGVALAAIQGLNRKLEGEVRSLEAENAALKDSFQRLQERVEALEAGRKP